MRSSERLPRCKVAGALIVAALCLMVGCERDAVNPLDPKNPASNVVVLPAPEGVRATPDWDVVVLEWHDVARSDGYQVFRGGKFCAAVPDTRYEDQGLSPGGTYSYQVAAVHASGLAGRLSAPVPVTTQSGPRVACASRSLMDMGYTAVGNGDGAANRGETVILIPVLRNRGNRIAEQVSLTAVVDDPYATLDATTATRSFGDIVVGGTSTISPYLGYRVSIAGNAPGGHRIVIGLSAVDAGNTAWRDSMVVVVEGSGAALKYETLSLDDGVYGEGNGDGIINRGETIRIAPVLRNTGASSTQGLVVTMAVDDPLVILDSSTQTVPYGDVRSGETATIPMYNGFRLSVSNQCLPGHRVRLRLTMEDSYSNVWQDSTSVTVDDTGARIVYHSCTIDDGIFGSGNGDGVINKGETFRVAPVLRNSGMSSTQGLVVTVAVDDPFVVLDPSTRVRLFGDVRSGETTTIQMYTAYRLVVSEATPAGHVVRMGLTVSDRYGNEWSDGLSLTVDP